MDPKALWVSLAHNFTLANLIHKGAYVICIALVFEFIAWWAGRRIEHRCWFGTHAVGTRSRNPRSKHASHPSGSTSRCRADRATSDFCIKAPISDGAHTDVSANGVKASWPLASADQTSV